MEFTRSGGATDRAVGPHSVIWYRRKLGEGGGVNGQYTTHQPCVCGLTASADVRLRTVSRRYYRQLQALVETTVDLLHVYFLVSVSVRSRCLDSTPGTEFLGSSEALL